MYVDSLYQWFSNQEVSCPWLKFANGNIAEREDLRQKAHAKFIANIT